MVRLLVVGALSCALSFSALASTVRDSTFGANDGSSVLEWAEGSWSACSGSPGRVCGSTAGTQARPIGCQKHPLAGGGPQPASVSACEEGLGVATRPQDARTCTTAPAQACHWNTGSWSACSAASPACGATTTGTQSRSSQCIATTPGQPNQARPDGQCASAIGAKPGNYANALPFAKANSMTFDAIAIGSAARLTIYSQPNYGGSILLDVQGPKIILNQYLSGAIMTDPDRTGPIGGQFASASAFMRASSNMHSWGAGTSFLLSCN